MVQDIYIWHNFSSWNKEIENKVSSILKWWKSEINLNQNKLGVMKLLYRSGKVKRTKSTENISKVSKYRYLGITINQSLYTHKK